MASTDLGICVVGGVTFQVPYMNDAELRNLTKHDFAYKLRSINTGLPCESFVIEKLRSVFHVVLDRTHPSNCSNEYQVALRKWALYKV